MSAKLSAEQLEYWHNSVEGDQDVDDEYETTVGEITALLDHITALESELKTAQAEINAHRCLLKKVRDNAINDFRAKLVDAVREKQNYYDEQAAFAHGESRRQRSNARAWMAAEIIQLITTFEAEQ